jgi:GTP-binding protein
MENDPYVGKCYLGKIQSGVLRVGDKIKALDGDGNVTCEGKCTKILLRKGLDRTSVSEAGAGDIISIAGLDQALVNHTLCAPEVSEPLPVIFSFLYLTSLRPWILPQLQ